MILTLTANPSHDRTVTLASALERGAVQRAASVISQAGGKGINISRASVAAGVPSLAVLPAPADDPFVLELLAAGIDCRAVEHPGELRSNIALTEPDGTTTKVNTPGPAMTPATLDALTAALHLRARPGDWVVLAGSLPPGTPDHWYADLVAALADCGAKIAVDTSEAPLHELVKRLHVAAPHLMKPNGDELASFTGQDPARLEADPLAAARAAADLVAAGVEAVLATLGPHGAVLVTAEGAWHATPAAHPGRQHGRSGRLQPLRLPARRDRGPVARPQTRARRRLRQRGRRTSRHHRPPPLPGHARARPGPRPPPHPRKVTPCPT